jgi:SAM-dependent methyltransferase
MSAYDAAFFDYVNTTARASAEHILPLLNSELAPASVLDVGCGRGAWLAVWRALGVEQVLGVDGDYVDRNALLIPSQLFLPLDVKNGFDLGRRFDFVQCLEVAEHVPASCAQRFLDSLIRHGSVIFFSAAPPGQGGHDHVNERSYEYWRQQFAQRGYLPLDFVRPMIRDDRRVAPWYRYNPLLFVHAERFADLSPALRASRIAEGATVPDWAPLAYRIRRQLVRRLPVAAMTMIARVKERLIGRRSAT